MPVPVAIALLYLLVNFTVMLGLEVERAAGRRTPFAVSFVAGVLRYGPPLAGVVYLVAVSGDWLFIAFVAGFFALGFWLMTGLVAYTDRDRD